MADITDNDANALTKCSECGHELSEPKCLPCTHTFCCSCLDSLCRKTIPGGQQHCPLCKHTFRVPTNGCQCLPDNPLVGPLQRLRDEMEVTRTTARRLDELNQTLEAHNIEAGSRCVENVIRASKATVELETRLTEAERERDEVRQRLQEIEQQQSTTEQRCQQCRRQENGPREQQTTQELSVRANSFAHDTVDDNNRVLAGRTVSRKAVLFVLLAAITVVICSSIINGEHFVKTKKELESSMTECSKRVIELTGQLAKERFEQEEKLANMKQKHVEQLESVEITCDSLTDNSWTWSMLCSLCGSSFVHCCRVAITTPDIV